MPKGTPGMNGRTKTHVEGHNCAIMRLFALTQGFLHINRVPCSGPTGCGALLPFMLPSGAEIGVIGPGGFGECFKSLT
jgi:hypothetical protein